MSKDFEEAYNTGVLDAWFELNKFAVSHMEDGDVDMADYVAGIMEDVQKLFKGV